MRRQGSSASGGEEGGRHLYKYPRWFKDYGLFMWRKGDRRLGLEGVRAEGTNGVFLIVHIFTDGLRRGPAYFRIRVSLIYASK